MRFRFTLEPLLKARRMTEERHQRIVADIERLRMKLEDDLRRQQGNITSGRHQLRDSLSGSLNVQSLRMHASCSMQLLRQAQRIVLELAGVHKRLEAARAAGSLRCGPGGDRGLQQAALVGAQWQPALFSFHARQLHMYLGTTSGSGNEAGARRAQGRLPLSRCTPLGEYWVN